LTLKRAVAAYVYALEDCLANTHRAEDRSLYEKYLANAAGILPSCVGGEPIANVVRRIEAHERLWGHAWLQDPIYRKAASAWGTVKEEVSTAKGLR
jgi:hypothetical protein